MRNYGIVSDFMEYHLNLLLNDMADSLGELTKRQKINILNTRSFALINANGSGWLSFHFVLLTLLILLLIFIN